MRAPIQSQKHYVQQTRASISTVSAGTMLLIDAVESTSANLVYEVSEGAIVKAVFIEIWIENSANTGTFGLAVIKTPQGSAPNYTNLSALGTYNNKKNVLFYSQGLPPNDGVSGPVPIIRQWIKIPKGKQRFGLGDRLYVAIMNAGGDTLDYYGS